MEQDNYLFQSNYWLPSKGGTEFALFVIFFAGGASRRLNNFDFFAGGASRRLNNHDFSPAALRAASVILMVFACGALRRLNDSKSPSVARQGWDDIVWILVINWDGQENALAEHAAQQGDGRNAEDPY